MSFQNVRAPSSAELRARSKTLSPRGPDDLPTPAQLDLLRTSELHHYFLHILTSEFGLIKKIAVVSESADSEKLAKTMVHVLSVYGENEVFDDNTGSSWNGSSLRLLFSLLEDEFQSKAESDPSAILRANNLVSRLQLYLAKEFVTDYVHATVGVIVKEIIEQNIDLEIDPSKIKVDPSQQEIKSRENAAALAALCTRILESLTNPENIAKLPRPVRAICGFVSEMSKKYVPSRVSVLVGGFIMLRIINPAVIAPATAGIIATTFKIPPNVFRTLTLTTKVLQNLANNIKFGMKEPYMVPLNEFIDANADKMVAFLELVATDPLTPEKPWQDYKSVLVLPKKLPPLSFASKVKLQDLVFLQHQFNSQKEKIYDKITDVKSKELFFCLLEEMGAPLDPNLKTISLEDLEKQRTVRRFMVSLEKFTPENLINQEILPNEELRDSTGLRAKVKNLMEDKKVINQIKEHQFTTLHEIYEKLSHPLLGVTLKESYFIASEAVDWVYSNLRLRNRDQAIQLCAQLAESQLILSKDRLVFKFKDSNKEWRFATTEEITFLKKNIEKSKESKKGVKEDSRSSRPVKNPADRKMSISTKTDQSELTEKDWQLLLIGAILKKYSPGEAIVREGETNDKLFKLKTGTATISKKRSGENQKLASIGAGAMFCEMSVLDKDGLISATIVAETDVEVWAIEVSFIHSLFEVEPDLSKRFYKSMALTIAKRLSGIKDNQQTKVTTKGDIVLKEFTCSKAKHHFISETVTLAISHEKISLIRRSKREDLKYDTIFSIEKHEKTSTLNILTTGKKNYALSFRSATELGEAHLMISRIWTTERQAIRNSKLKGAILISTSTDRSPLVPVKVGSGSTLYKNELLDARDWELIRCGARVATFKPDRAIVKQNYLQPSIYFITKGRCRVELETEEDEVKVVAHLETGQMFGEISFLVGGKGTATVLAHEDKVEVQIIDDAYLNILFVRQPALAGRFYHYLASLLSSRLKSREKVISGEGSTPQ
eukprot:TRINITY_DN3671_c0_g1_i1.p1 TRINITY_DN3671_c0_g1~~TRINITY_DN3671_c0_g1_i1.p1  ORF type:complete len:1002 (+),score=213.21 TRINITY_DN3671_c0_g1_i1:63-3068(+)